MKRKYSFFTGPALSKQLSNYGANDSTDIHDKPIYDIVAIQLVRFRRWITGSRVEP